MISNNRSFSHRSDLKKIATSIAVVLRQRASGGMLAPPCPDSCHKRSTRRLVKAFVATTVFHVVRVSVDCHGFGTCDKRGYEQEGETVCLHVPISLTFDQ
jgi:hypothetical protein